MENMIQYVWKNRLYDESGLVTTGGNPVSVIDSGTQNSDSGPDFFNAKVRISDTVWAGNVEIHKHASDWTNHGHDKDKAYDSVILHVVGVDDEPDNLQIPKLVLKIPEKIEKNIEWLLTRDSAVSCAGRIYAVPEIFISDWLSALVTERLKRKAKDITERLKLHDDDWNEAFYITLMRNFGFGTNSDAFEWLANSLPYKYIMKHRNNPLQVEALLFGQAGLLENIDSKDEYYLSLLREYEFLRKKYDLHPVDGFLFKRLRLRPVNFPHLRIAQISSVFIHYDLMFSHILETDEIEKLLLFFDTEPTTYWETHYGFHGASPERKKPIGRNAAAIILINTVVPILFAYGKIKDIPEYIEKAMKILEQIPAENNNITRLFQNAGIKVKNACDSQALIQLRNEYCDRKKCLYCRIGFKVIGI